MATAIHIADLIDRHINEAARTTLFKRRRKPFPIEFPDRRALGKILTQRKTSLLPYSGSIRFEPLPGETEPRLFAETITAFPKNHPTFRGHFPKFPVVRSVDLVELIGQTGSLLLALLDPRNKRHLVGTFSGGSVSFSGNVQPDTTVISYAWLEDDPALMGKLDSPDFLVTGSIAGYSMVAAKALGGEPISRVVAKVQSFGFRVQPRELIGREPPA